MHEVSETRTRALLSNYFYFRHLTISDIYQLRKQLEPELVSGLAGKLDAAAIAELRAITGEYDTPPQNKEDDKLHHEASSLPCPTCSTREKSSSRIYYWFYGTGLIRGYNNKTPV